MNSESNLDYNEATSDGTVPTVCIAFHSSFFPYLRFTMSIGRI